MVRLYFVYVSLRVAPQEFSRVGSEGRSNEIEIESLPLLRREKGVRGVVISSNALSGRG